MHFALALAFTLAAPSGDRWTGRDKLKHFAAAAAIQSLSYAAWRGADASRPAALWRATAVTATVSLGKETLDWRRGGRFSNRDLVWDAGGAGAATLAIIHGSRK
ncbi:MAG: hypothetical protein IPF98_05215 [Gemmatimonadetes bacterium]|nr:hypothetical protein [Gemmatimonadota bacterium]